MKIFVFILFTTVALSQDRSNGGLWSLYAHNILNVSDSSSQNLTSGSLVQVSFNTITDTLNISAAKPTTNPISTFWGTKPGLWKGELRLTLKNGQLVNTADFEIIAKKNDTLIVGVHALQTIPSGSYSVVIVPINFTATHSDTTAWDGSPGTNGKGYFTLKFYVYVNQTTCTISNATVNGITYPNQHPSSAQLYLEWKGYR